MKAVAILISGNGSNLQALIDNSKDIGIDIQIVISNQENAYGINRAKKANIATRIIPSRALNTDIFEQKIITTIDSYNINFIILAGFMRILSSSFINKYKDKIINIHPSLLPKFKGLNTHKKVLIAKEKFHGASVHLVTNKLDGGEIIMQKKIKILTNDNETTLAKRVLTIEHLLYPKAIKYFIKTLL